MLTVGASIFHNQHFHRTLQLKLKLLKKTYVFWLICWRKTNGKKIDKSLSKQWLAYADDTKMLAPAFPKSLLTPSTKHIHFMRLTFKHLSKPNFIKWDRVSFGAPRKVEKSCSLQSFAIPWPWFAWIVQTKMKCTHQISHILKMANKRQK